MKWTIDKYIFSEIVSVFNLFNKSKKVIFDLFLKINKNRIEVTKIQLITNPVKFNLFIKLKNSVIMKVTNPKHKIDFIIFNEIFFSLLIL